MLQTLFSSFIPFLDVGPSAWGAEAAATKACADTAHPLCCGIGHIEDNWQETGNTGELELTMFPSKKSPRPAGPCQLQVFSLQPSSAKIWASFATKPREVAQVAHVA